MGPSKSTYSNWNASFSWFWHPTTEIGVFSFSDDTIIYPAVKPETLGSAWTCPYSSPQIANQSSSHVDSISLIFLQYFQGSISTVITICCYRPAGLLSQHCNCSFPSALSPPIYAPPTARVIDLTGQRFLRGSHLGDKNWRRHRREPNEGVVLNRGKDCPRGKSRYSKSGKWGERLLAILDMLSWIC